MTFWQSWSFLSPNRVRKLSSIGNLSYSPSPPLTSTPCQTRLIYKTTHCSHEWLRERELRKFKVRGLTKSLQDQAPARSLGRHLACPLPFGARCVRTRNYFSSSTFFPYHLPQLTPLWASLIIKQRFVLHRQDLSRCPYQSVNNYPCVTGVPLLVSVFITSRELFDKHHIEA